MVWDRFWKYSSCLQLEQNMYSMVSNNNPFEKCNVVLRVPGCRPVLHSSK